MTVETYAFQAEINQLLSLIINAFYSNKDVFLRELVSNASDALDKIRYKSLTEGSSVLGDITDLRIRIEADKEANTLTITDTGIGMTKDELVKNLGTIAHSGTKAFMQALKEGTTDLSLIGQFGMGFYSAFLVADKVRVISKSNDDGNQYVWESSASGSFNVAMDNDTESIGRGTKIVLFMKDDQKDYLEEARIRDIITRHSQFIDFPIELQVEREVQQEVASEPEPVSVSSETTVVEEVEEGGVTEEDSSVPKQTSTITVKKTDWEQLNKQKPLWTRNATEVTQEEYAAFYKSVFNDWDDHMAVKHFSAEGQIQYKSVLFLPKRAPFDMFNTDKKNDNIKLYVRRVFIMDDCEKICPSYLSFVKGIVDTDDLPLNVSREMLQQNSVIRVIQKSLVKKCIEMFHDLAENNKEDYKTFFDNFGKNIKLGVHEDSKNRDKLVELLRFYSSKSGDDMTSLKDYVVRMKEDQKDIYYITGESKLAVQDSPFLEGLRKRGYEVLYMVEPIDEYMVQQLTEYDGKKLVCCSKEGLVFEDEKDDLEKKQEEYKDLCHEIKTVLAGKVEEVKVSGRVNDTPCVLVTPQYGWTANMERIAKAQALRANDGNMMGYMTGRRILEINPDHKMIKELKRRCDENNNEDKATTNRLINLLFETSLLSSGFSIPEPAKYARSIFNIMMAGISMDDQDETDNANVHDNNAINNEDTAVESENKMEELD